MDLRDKFVRLPVDNRAGAYLALQSRNPFWFSQRPAKVKGRPVFHRASFGLAVLPPFIKYVYRNQAATLYNGSAHETDIEYVSRADPNSASMKLPTNG